MHWNTLCVILIAPYFYDYVWRQNMCDVYRVVMLGICFISPCVMLIAPFCNDYALDHPTCDTYSVGML